MWMMVMTMMWMIVMKVTVVMEEESRDAAEAKPQAGQDAVAVPANGDGPGASSQQSLVW